MSDPAARHEELRAELRELHRELTTISVSGPSESSAARLEQIVARIEEIQEELRQLEDNG